MKPISFTPETRPLAERLVWFEPADADLIEALDHALPGVTDPCSCDCWNAHPDRIPAAPPPRRLLL